MPIHDAALGEFQLTGHWSEVEGAQSAVVLIHGLGGNSESGYLRRISHCARQLGLSTLHLNLRGADKLGPDLYHAGQWQDVDQCLRSKELSAYTRLHLVGYSLGGHVALRCAAHSQDARLHRVASVCAPLDLALGAKAFERWPRLYAQHVLKSLRTSYRAVFGTWRSLDKWSSPCVEEVERISTISEWDERIVAPRHGFASAAEYYREESAATCLQRIERDTLFIAADSDPMVPLHTLEAALSTRSAAVHVHRYSAGGHLGFPRSLARSVDEQVLDFLTSD